MLIFVVLLLCLVFFALGFLIGDRKADFDKSMGGWIVTNADGSLFRTWDTQGFGPEWTPSLAQATRFYARVDAEDVHAGDDDAWHVVPYAHEFLRRNSTC